MRASARASSTGAGSADSTGVAEGGSGDAAADVLGRLVQAGGDQVVGGDRPAAVIEAGVGEPARAPGPNDGVSAAADQPGRLHLAERRHWSLASLGQRASVEGRYLGGLAATAG